MGPRIFKIADFSHGFLAMMAKPTTGEWIDEEFSGLARSGIQQVASLLEPEEANQLGLGEEASLCKRYGLRFAGCPIPDRGLPPCFEDYAAFTWNLFCDIEEGISTVVHCRAGIGRAGLTAATILTLAGKDAKDAFRLVSEARGVAVPDTEEQINWLIDNEDDLHAWTHRIELSPEDVAQVAGFDAADIETIDRAILRTAGQQWLKVAMVVARTEEALRLSGRNLPVSYLHQRVRALIEKGDLEAQGDLRRLRFSEIRLPG